MNAEDSLRYEKFRQQVETLKGDELLDKWIEFDGSSDSKEPDMGLAKSLCLEAALTMEFGVGAWQKAVEARRKAHQGGASAS
jgi:hypothetical protein